MPKESVYRQLKWGCGCLHMTINSNSWIEPVKSWQQWLSRIILGVILVIKIFPFVFTLGLWFDYQTMSLWQIISTLVKLKLLIKINWWWSRLSVEYLMQKNLKEKSQLYLSYVYRDLWYASMDYIFDRCEPTTVTIQSCDTTLENWDKEKRKKGKKLMLLVRFNEWK